MTEAKIENKHVHRNRYIYNVLYRELRNMKLKEDVCIDMIEKHDMNSNKVTGWKLSWNRIKNIIDNPKTREE